MLSWMKARTDRRRRASDLYGAVVTQARAPAFYARHGVADTPEGRYEMIVLHLALVLDRLGAATADGPDLARTLAETFVTDMDDSMREMGVGDLTVPRKVKRAAGGLYDRTLAYRTALQEPGEAALAGLLARHIPGHDTAGAASETLAIYARQLAAMLAGQADADLLDGRIAFPDPASA